MVGLFLELFVSGIDEALEFDREAALERDVAALLCKHKEAPHHQQRARQVHGDVLEACKSPHTIESSTKEARKRTKCRVGEKAATMVGDMRHQCVAFTVFWVACIKGYKTAAHPDTMEATNEACEKNTAEKSPHDGLSFLRKDRLLGLILWWGPSSTGSLASGGTG